VRPFIVAIDGPAGAGKSTVSKILARRLGFLFQKGVDSSLEEVLADQTKRDRDDSARAVAPLKAAEDAVRMDSSVIPLSEVVQRLESEILRRLAQRMSGG
jgi:cytidylate kinase